MVESVEFDANSSMKIPLNGEATTSAYFNVPPLIAVPSCVTSELNFDFEVAFDASDEVLLLFAVPHAANVKAAAADKNTILFFFIFPPLSDTRFNFLHVLNCLTN